MNSVHTIIPSLMRSRPLDPRTRCHEPSLALEFFYLIFWGFLICFGFLTGISLVFVFFVVARYSCLCPVRTWTGNRASTERSRIRQDLSRRHLFVIMFSPFALNTLGFKQGKTRECVYIFLPLVPCLHFFACCLRSARVGFFSFGFVIRDL